MGSPITTHILDTSCGQPAAGVPITLEIDDGGWTEVGGGVTNADGRLPDLLPEGGLACATYRITFETAAYWAARGETGFYPYAQVVFTITDLASHYHVPLLLNPYGYSTYRGS